MTTRTPPPPPPPPPADPASPSDGSVVGDSPFLSSLVAKGQAQLEADRATAWTQDLANFLLLEKHVSLSVGTYGFRADRAVVKIETRPDARGEPGPQRLTIYLDNARPLRGKGPVEATAQRLAVTVSTRQPLSLSTSLRSTQPDHDR